MAVKKLKVIENQYAIPEGFTYLPAPLLFFQRSIGRLWGNPPFESKFGKAFLSRFDGSPHLGLIRERPVHLELFSSVGRHEGFILENVNGDKIPVELKVSEYSNSPDTFVIMVEDVADKMNLETQLIQKHFELQDAFQELQKTQEALVQSAKLASLGELSSGIAHELNQPLQAIMGFSQELEIQEPLSPLGREFIGDIISASRKMAEIIRSLRSFARVATGNEVDTSIEFAVSEASKLMHHQLMQKGIDLEMKSKCTLPMISADPIQLEQVFVNLLSNARDAIDTAHPGRGKIQVTLDASPDWILVSVKDDGCGMDEAIQKKIFDPFFTTKEVGKGTGLGLSISYGILKKLKAETKVISAPGNGTEFVIRFPVRKGEAA